MDKPKSCKDGCPPFQTCDFCAGKTDDLVKRLQDYLDMRPWAVGRTFDPTHPECLIAQAKDRIEYLEEVLSVALIYLDDEADVVDGEDGKPVANRAMSVASFIRMGLGNQDA